jgi:hypothetical protein
MMGGQPTNGNFLLFEPSTKMLNSQDVMAHPYGGVASGMQIQYEAGENYAEMIGCHPSADQCTRKEPLDNREI